MSRGGPIRLIHVDTATDGPPEVDPDGHPHETVLHLGRAVHRSGVPDLCARLRRLLAGAAGPVIVDAAALTEPDAVTLEALARLALTARRQGGSLRLRHAGEPLRRLLEFAGLAGVVPLEPP